MIRWSRFTLIILTTALPLAVGAPVPSGTRKDAELQRLFGRPVTVEGTSIELDGPRLRVKMASSTIGKGNRFPDDFPRVEKAITGDFAASVVVHIPLPANVPPAEHVFGTINGPYIHGFLAASFSPGHFFYLDRLYHPSFGGEGERSWMDRFDLILARPCPPWLVENLKSRIKINQPVHLSITRQGDRLTAERSFNGEEWETLKEVEEPTPPTIQLMLGGRQDLGKPCEVIFEKFTVGPPNYADRTKK